MFNIIRIVLWAVIVLMLLCIVKFTHIKRRTAVLMVIVCTGMVVISGIFPTENLFIKFRSPYDVFHYVMSGDVKGLLNGKNSCAVIYSDGKYDGGNLIIPKVEDGYQIPNYFLCLKGLVIDLIATVHLIFIKFPKQKITIFLEQFFLLKQILESLMLRDDQLAVL